MISWSGVHWVIQVKYFTQNRFSFQSHSAQLTWTGIPLVEQRHEADKKWKKSRQSS